MTDREQEKSTGTELEDSFNTDKKPALIEEGTRDTAAITAAVPPVVEEAYETEQTESLVTALKEVGDTQPDGGEVLDRADGETGDLYPRILEVLHKAGDLGIDAVAKGHILEAMQGDTLPQLACRNLVANRIINKVQLARAVARAQHRMEIMSFLDLPSEATQVKENIPDQVATLLRSRRIIPIKEEELKEGKKKLDLGHEGAVKDLVLETTLAELMPGYSFQWHFCMREVAGAFWLAGSHQDVDVGMEAEALLDRIIGNAIDARSSDIHIDPSIRGEPRAVVKYRVDGSVMPKEVITTEQLDRLRVRIENLARMPKVNHNHPNKGSFTRAGYDWRVQIQPHSSPHGPVPRIVLRQLKPDVMPMEALGYPQYFIDKIKSAAQATNGVVFWTGPTGSGKTESIHSAIVSVNPMGKGLSVHTIEDPPEKRVPGYAIQMEAVETDPPRTALELLKSSLRADPDVVVFGEVRDKEMAKLVFEAANTGHLVFSTLHTNTALDAVVRLGELGVDGFLISYIRGIASQKLVRRLCTHCRVEMTEPDEYTRYVFDRYGVELEGATLYKANPQGCLSCNFKGYYGRIAVAEWLKPSKELVDMCSRGEYEDIEDVARRAGWQPMGYMGVLHVKNSITDATELSRTILELSGDLLG
ncbi:MAG: ATPase, T2SS/T4P/T4SS family [Alphaproteobacteria bacterium]|nr:ATPase, T2SS/T4P/T4SS family [Alphaproteobacteria bacterium]MDD9920361.1 ATPase, T2SS/T4P/T4SS family [Alphaproteobacteria bacterium]